MTEKLTARGDDRPREGKIDRAMVEDRPREGEIDRAMVEDADTRRVAGKGKTEHAYLARSTVNTLTDVLALLLLDTLSCIARREVGSSAYAQRSGGRVLAVA